jgi:hypothetical protein
VLARSAVSFWSGIAGTDHDEHFARTKKVDRRGAKFTSGRVDLLEPLLSQLSIRANALTFATCLLAAALCAEALVHGSSDDAPKEKRRSRFLENAVILSGCGGRIRTDDLRVMSPRRTSLLILST